MRKLLHLVIYSIILSTFASRSYAIIPLEYLVLGDFPDGIVKYDDNNPLDYHYINSEKLEDGQSDLKSQKKIAIYRGYYEEGRNLDNFCKTRPTIRFSTDWEREQVKLSMLATLQYIGLVVTTKAIGKYSQKLNYTEEEYSNLVENLVGNFCSNNTSVISLKKLKYDMKKAYLSNNYELPTIQNSPLFSEKMNSSSMEEEARENEFKATIKLFQSFCSWGTSSTNLRLLVPLVRNPIVQSFVIRQMTNNVLAWEKINNNVVKKEDKNTLKVACDGLICRKVVTNDFEKRLSKGIGQDSLEADLRVLYCQDLRDVDFSYQNQEQKIKGMISEMTLDQQALLNGQFISLLTGVPEFLFWNGTFKDLQKMAKYSIENRWQRWAKKKLEKYDSDLMYEETLSLEVVNRRHYFNKFQRDFKVHVDINVGEFDRSMQIVGKISTRFNLNISRKFLTWVRKKWINRNPQNVEEEKKIFERFVKIIEDQVEKSKNKFDLPPWKEGLERLIAKELLEQVSQYSGEFYQTEDQTFELIPIYLNYGPFALKYLNFIKRAQIEKEDFKSL